MKLRTTTVSTDLTKQKPTNLPFRALFKTLLQPYSPAKHHQEPIQNLYDDFRLLPTLLYKREHRVEPWLVVLDWHLLRPKGVSY